MAGLLLAAIALSACQKAESVSTKDPLPLPSGMAENKDLSVKPGDSFYDYCNGSWIKKTPIPASGAKGGLYEQVPEMEQRVEQLKAENADIRRMYELLDADSGQPEASKIFIDGLKARFPGPRPSRSCSSPWARCLPKVSLCGAMPSCRRLA